MLFFLQAPGYGAEMKKDSLDAYQFPSGNVWQRIIKEGHLKTNE